MKKILVVEDDPDIGSSLKKLLELEGHEVHVASNGKLALEFLQASKALPSLIILDLMMPVMDGFQFCEEQGRDVNLASIPVAIMTADGHIESKSKKVEASAFLRKPVDINDVLAIVHRFCGSDL